MNSLILLNIALVFHLVGLTLIAGSTVVDFITRNRPAPLSVFPVVARAGIALLVLSGIAMMTVMHGAYGTQIWMRIKIGLVLLVIINVLFVRRREKLMRVYHISQLVLFIVIITLSVFKFN